ncbi:hypothetical protein SB724_20800, partial [Bacillus sp. SIMBA_031]|uniref:hypothetical protein n=1 Tax=Bacillus sp. SIMBA_031 TaxID=3085774 RepID=UPI00397DD4FC
SVNGDVPQELSILGSDYIIGMPLHHNKREILFHKFILIRDDVLESYSHLESDLKSKLISFIDEDCINDVHVEIIDSGLEPVLGIT